jgi:hypothetical protein
MLMALYYCECEGVLQFGVHRVSKRVFNLASRSAVDVMYFMYKNNVGRTDQQLKYNSAQSQRFYC